MQAPKSFSSQRDGDSGRCGAITHFGSNAASYVVLLAVCTFVVPADGQEKAVPVGTVYAELKPIAKTKDFVGRVESVGRVSVQARVKGYLEAVLFKEGDFVNKGDPLYHIERGPFQAAVDDAQGAVERSQSAKDLTQIQLQRAEQLLEKSAGTAVARDEALAKDKEAGGELLSHQANLDNANINLSYTDIVAPIAGKISKTNVTVGNVVGPESGVLTTIVSQDPMWVTFPVSQRDFLTMQTNPKEIKVKVRFENGTTYNQLGTINFIDVTVDRATDTVLVRATMPNPNGVLVDGQLVTVVLEAGHPEQKVMVPQAALIADQEGIYVFVVEDGKAAVRRIKTGGESGPNDIVEEGLKGGEPVVVQGIQSIRPGQPVQATPIPASLKTD